MHNIVTSNPNMTGGEDSYIHDIYIVGMYRSSTTDIHYHWSYILVYSGTNIFIRKFQCSI